jgi:hypothetical protein
MEETKVPLGNVMQTRFVVTVECKMALSDADLRFLEADIKRRLQIALVQKFASVDFKRS